MKLRYFLTVLPCLVAGTAGMAAYAEVLPADSDFTLGIIGDYLYYEETQSGSFFDSDSGALLGIDFNYRQDLGPLLVLVDANFTYSNAAFYNGSLQHFNGTVTPYTTQTPEMIWLIHGDLGWKVPATGPFYIAPCAGAGYRDWARGMDNPENYDQLETYSWFFVDAGMAIHATVHPWEVNLLAQIAYPLSPTMSTNLRGIIPYTTFYLGTVPAYLISAKIQHAITRNAQKKIIYISLSPWYQHWGIGKSNTDYFTINGTEYSVYEPDSSTDIFGISLGVGIDL